MIYYTVLFVLSILIYLSIKKRDFLLVEFFLFSSLFCLRSPLMGIGSDTIRYVEKFNQMGNVTLTSLLTTESLTDGVGFSILMKLFSFIGLNAQFFVGFCFCFFLFITFLFIKKYSKNYLLSVLTLYACFIFPSCSFIRQFFALSLCLLTFLLFDKKKYFKSALIFIFALSVHFSALIMLIVLIVYVFFNKEKNSKNILWLLCLIGGFLLIPVIKGIILQLISILSPQYYHYLMYGIYGTDLKVSLIWPLVLSLPLLLNAANDILKNKILLKNEIFNNERVFSISLNVGVFIFFLASIVTEFYRVSQYLTIFYIIMLPNTIEKISNKNTKFQIKMIFIFLIFIYMMTSTINNYDFSTFKFFWQ